MNRCEAATTVTEMSAMHDARTARCHRTGLQFGRLLKEWKRYHEGIQDDEDEK
jgi:hypothetical protein